MYEILALSTQVFILTVGLIVLGLVLLYVKDRFSSNAVLRNYPVIGHARYILKEVGVFLRSYFFAADREELPFNRFQRDYVNNMSDNKGGVIAFGSSYDGGITFANSPYPQLTEDVQHVKAVTFGSDTSNPYTTTSYFNVSGTSYGALSGAAIQALSNGCKLAGAYHNTGEGGFSPFHKAGGGDTVFQIGTANYGVRNKDGSLSYTKLKELAKEDQIKMFEIKLSQGAKPGKGGILPGEKVTKIIAETRGIAVGEDSISPNRRTDVSNPEELTELIQRVKDATGKPVGIKFVLGRPEDLDGMLDAFQSRNIYPSFITLDSADGGTGAAPAALMDHVGMFIEDSLPILMAKLEDRDLSETILVQASGKLITPAEIAWALATGAVSVLSARGPMFALGCIMALQCNTNKCPTGIATQDKKLIKGLKVPTKAERVAAYLTNTRGQVGYIAHSTGAPCARSIDPTRVLRG